ncbi:MAG: hypothetical protein HFF52_05745 [Lawsonibacter sp.]|nr:hypothetical protein [Lawsonibacter sp.]
MSSKHTPNYNLSQWESEDKVLRTDFNADNAKIDAGLRALDTGKADKSTVTALGSQLAALEARTLRLATGSYTGAGTNSRTVSFPFPPKFVWIQRLGGDDQKLISFNDTAMCIFWTGRSVYNSVSGGSFTFSVTGSTAHIASKGSYDPEDQTEVAMNADGANYIWMILG